MLSTAVMITLIICVTIVLLALGGIINTSMKIRAMEDMKDEIIDKVISYIVREDYEDDE